MSSKKKDLFTIFGCRKCPYRMRAEDGCMKFSLTKADINRGIFVTTLNHGAFAFSETKPCPYAS